MKKTLLILCALLLTAVGASAQTEYKFVCTDWGSIDLGRVTDDNVTYDETNNTITVVASGTNNVALSNGREAPFTTASYTVTKDQYWFIVVGTNLSTEDDASDLWWMNGANHNTNVVPTNVVELEDGKVLLAWDLVLSGIDTNLQDETNYLNGWTGFGLTSTTGTSVISDICFYTTEEAVKAYPSLEGVLQDATPYEFVCTDWVSLDTDRLSNDNITYNEDNTITVNAGTGANNVALGNSPTATWESPYLDVTTANYYVTNDQCWFVVVGTNLATGKTVTNDACDSYLWWMDGANYGQWPPTEVAESDDGSVVIAWDLSTMTEIDVNLQDEVNLLSGWTGFGLTSTTGTSVISDINFYTYEEMIETYPGLDQRAPYTFVCTDWVGVSGRSADDGQVTYSGNTITVNATGNNNIALFNGSGENSVNTTNYYITSDQKYFVVVGSNLNTSNTDNTYSQLWWMNGVGGPSAAPDNVVELATTGEILFAWNLSAIDAFSSVLTPDNDGHITLTGWTGFGLTSTGSSSTISYIGFYTEAQLEAATNGVEWEMTDAGWGTLILPFDADIPTDEEGTAALTLYAGSALTVDGSTITVGTAATTIAANTPYLVSGTEGKYTFTGTPEEATTLTSGLLTGTLVDMTQEDFTANGTEYVLQNHEGENGEEGEGLAFYPITSESSDVTLEAYHCYLTLDNSTSPDGVRAFISLPDSDDVATAIEAVESDVIANDAIYDLSGRRVSKAVKGVYIQNGKKVLVK